MTFHWLLHQRLIPHIQEVNEGPGNFLEDCALCSAAPSPVYLSLVMRTGGEPAGVLTAGSAAEEPAQKRTKAGLKKKQGISW